MWSDGFQDAPMLPRVSHVQKCPHCGKYFVIDYEKPAEYGDSMSFDTGKLTIAEMCEAYIQLIELQLKMSDVPYILESLIFAFNDEYGRQGKKCMNSKQQTLFDAALRNMAMSHADEIDPVLVGEYWRELGEFDTCIDTLSKVKPCNEYQAHIMDEIIKHAKQGDKDVFEIPSHERALQFEYRP